MLKVILNKFVNKTLSDVISMPAAESTQGTPGGGIHEGAYWVYQV